MNEGPEFILMTDMMRDAMKGAATINTWVFSGGDYTEKKVLS